MSPLNTILDTEYVEHPVTSCEYVILIYMSFLSPYNYATSLLGSK